MQSVTERMKRAWILWEQRRPQLAMLEITEVLGQEPEHAEAHALLGLCLALEQQYERGLAEISVAITIDPEQSYWHWYLAMAYRWQGEIVTAKRSIDRAIRLEPGRVEFHIELAQLLSLAQQQSPAELDKILPDLDLDIDLLQPARNWQLRLQDIVRAVAERALHLDPENTTALELRMEALYGLQRRAEAEEAAHQLLRIDPNRAGAYNMLGIIHQYHQRWPESVQSLQMALSLQPNMEAARTNILYALAQNTWLAKMLRGYINNQYLPVLLCLSYVALVKMVVRDFNPLWLVPIIPGLLPGLADFVNQLLLYLGWTKDQRYRRLRGSAERRSLVFKGILLGVVILVIWGGSTGWLGIFWRSMLPTYGQNLLAAGLLGWPLLWVVCHRAYPLWQRSLLSIGLLIAYVTDPLLCPPILDLSLGLLLILPPICLNYLERLKPISTLGVRAFSLVLIAGATVHLGVDLDYWQPEASMLLRLRFCLFWYLAWLVPIALNSWRCRRQNG
jgi:tetratricopeptide (TPR) repeat protein